MKRVIFTVLIMVVFLAGCAEYAILEQARQTATTSDAAVARRNLESEEQNFKIFRRVVFYNGITGDYILQIEGMLSIIVDDDGDLVVTVKTQDGKYMKHYLGLSDNVTYFSEALASSDVSTRSYKVIFKPAAIIPTFELK